MRTLARFYLEARRSWSTRLPWAQFVLLAERYLLPPPRVVHSIYRREANP